MVDRSLAAPLHAAQRSQYYNERILLVETLPSFVNQPALELACLLVPYSASYGIPRKTHIYAAGGIKREEAIRRCGEEEEEEEEEP